MGVKTKKKKKLNIAAALFPATALYFLCVYLRLIAPVITNASDPLLGPGGKVSGQKMCVKKVLSVLPFI